MPPLNPGLLQAGDLFGPSPQSLISVSPPGPPSQKWQTVSKALPEGRRALLMQGLDSDIFKHPEDRCRDSAGSLDGFSKSPFGYGCFSGAAGADGINSGYSSVWIDHWTQNARLFAQQVVQNLADAGATVDFLIFDTEVGLTEWTPISSTWQSLMMRDPRWPGLKTKLDALVRARTGNPAASFPVTATAFGPSVNWKDWDAQMWSNMADGLNVIFNEFKAKWPNIKGSSYGFPGWKVNDGNFDLNGHPYYWLNVVGTHASWDSYGWLGQASSKTGGNDPWHTLLFEENKARGAIRAGYPIEPWVAFAIFSEGAEQWPADYRVPYPYSPNPHWKENVRHLALSGADPFLYFFIRLSIHPRRCRSGQKSDYRQFLCRIVVGH